jgi:hypothetical protein
MDAFEELYCRVSALELLVFALANQLDKKAFVNDLASQKERLLATATFAELSPEVAERMKTNVDRYARILLGSKPDKT